MGRRVGRSRSDGLSIVLGLCWAMKVEDGRLETPSGYLDGGSSPSGYLDGCMWKNDSSPTFFSEVGAFCGWGGGLEEVVTMGSLLCWGSVGQ